MWEGEHISTISSSSRSSSNSRSSGSTTGGSSIDMFSVEMINYMTHKSRVCTDDGDNDVIETVSK